MPQTPWRAKLEQLQGEMGIGDIKFDGPQAEPAETIIQRQLSAQMGVHDFELAVAPAIEEPPAPKQVTPKQITTKPPQPVTPKQEVREKRSTLASWFRSALTDRPQEPEQKPAAVTPVAKPAAPPMAAAPPAPAPVVTAPPPIVRPPESEAKPAPDPAASAKPLTPEDAAKTTFFTFDPIPPVPPRLPREPKDPPKKR
ncbi:MAG: hypothetical protein Q7R30_23265 [Acidobacteriota bacterium]|nr:hypothetical protein [Acidobacteriota bacterium]